MDTETAEEVLTLRGRAQLVSNTHMFNPRVRFSPDGRSLLAICDDRPHSLAVWSIPEDTSDETTSIRMARRRAVARHLDVAGGLSVKTGTEPRRIALDHLELAGRIGLESPQEFLTRARIFADLDLVDRAQDDLLKAAALAPGSRKIPTQAAFILGSIGRFRLAGLWYARVSDWSGGELIGDVIEHAVFLVLAGDHAGYRRFCAERERTADLSRSPWYGATFMAYRSGLEPGSAIDPDLRIRFARRGLDLVLKGNNPVGRTWALLALGSAYLRAGDLARAEPLFLEAVSMAPDGPLRALGAAWMAIALWHQGRRDEAKVWFDRADRFLRARVPGGRPEVEHRPPSVPIFCDWWHLLVAWREAQGLILDGDFPTDPFVPGGATPAGCAIKRGRAR